jgi:BASS family bile acid:Na+ symporter
MQAITALFNITVLVFIISTMFAAGLGTTLAALGGAFRHVVLVVLVLVVNLVLVPLLGWGMAAVFSLAAPAYAALVLIASSPGAPFGVKMAMAQRGDVVTASALQVLLAAVGSVTFPLTANWILSAANLGAGFSLPVGDLIKTVVILQLLPFGVGLALHTWTPETADEWRTPTLRVSGLAFPLVLVLALLGSWQQIVALLGSRTLLAAIVFTALAIVAGTLVASGSLETRTTVGLLAPMRNAGPVMAAVGIAFNNSPDVLAAVTGILLMGLVVGLPVASYLAKSRPAPAAQATAVGQPGATRRPTAPVEAALPVPEQSGGQMAAGT